MNTTTVDRITLEVIQHRLDSIVREMSNITLRTARSPVIHSGRDFSTGLFNHRAELLAIGTSIPIHVFPMLWQVRETLRFYPEDVAPGDIFIGNDPHDGGTHLNDVLIFLPVFAADTMVGFACNRAHWYDVGGMVPGSLSGFAREIYQEGLRIPPMRLGRDDRPDADLLRFIGKNVRMPHDALGDLMAQLASCRVARQRITEIVERYGVELMQSAFDEILDASERRMRTRIAMLPRTTVSHEGYLDNDGVEEERVRLRATVTVLGDEIEVDYTGTASQRAGCINVTMALAEGFAFMGVKSAVDPKGPVNSGCFRPVKVVAPEGSCINADEPAAGGGMCEIGQAAIITMVALGSLLPEQITAEEGGSANHQNFDGIDPRPGRGRYVFYDSLSSGGGARAAKDGLDFVRTIRAGNYTAMSVEALEHMYPFVFEAQKFRKDSGGPGRFRGGMGLDRSYRVLANGVISILSDHALTPPAGNEEGWRGAPTRWEVVRDGEVVAVSERFGSKGALDVREGEIVRVRTPGGGGWGDPLTRDPHRVLDDVRDGAVSVAQAREAYGVVIADDGRTVDAEGTARCRATLRAARSATPLERGGGVVLEHGVRVGWVGEDGPLAPGGLAEVGVASRPHPLTLRVVLDPAVSAGVLRLDAEAWDDLGLGDEAVSGHLRALSEARP